MIDTVGRKPSRLSATASAVAAAVGLAGGLYYWPALAVGTFGVAVVLLGVVRGLRSAVTAGCVILVGGSGLAGVSDAPAGAILLGVTATILAWDFGRTAIDLGAQLGRDADTFRLEALHLTASTVVGTLTVAGGYLVYATATGGRSLTAVLFAILGAIVLLTTVLAETTRLPGH